MNTIKKKTEQDRDNTNVKRTQEDLLGRLDPNSGPYNDKVVQRPLHLKGYCRGSLGLR